MAVGFFLIVATVHFFSAFLPENFQEQTNFSETYVPVTKYNWKQDLIESCIYKESGVPDSYYVWTKLAVQKWRQALREYTGNQQAWNITSHYVNSQADLESCAVKISIYG